MSNNEFQLTTIGIILLCISALIQALEIIVENRLFQIDPQMSAFHMQWIVSIWKMIFTIIILPFCSLVDVPSEYVTGGKFESFGPALSLLSMNKQLVWLFAIMALSNGLHAVLSMTIVKEESAMQR